MKIEINFNPMTAFITLALFFVILNVNATNVDFNHGDSSLPMINYSSLASDSCYKKEIDSLRAAYATNLQSSQDLEMGKATAYDRLAELGVNCP